MKKIKNYREAMKFIKDCEKEFKTILKGMRANARTHFTGKKKLGRPFGSKSKKKSESRATT